jgi:hypothetical protein
LGRGRRFGRGRRSCGLLGHGSRGGGLLFDGGARRLFVRLFQLIGSRLFGRIFVAGGPVLVFGDVLPKKAAQFQHQVVIERAGVRLFVRDAQFGEPIQ